MNKNGFSFMLANRTLALLEQSKARLLLNKTSFYVWPRENRAIVIFDPTAVNTSKVNNDFAHRLSTQLQGRMVVRTNSRGLFLQVAYEIPPALTDMTSLPLDLSKQPTPYDLPIGSTATGAVMWVNLMEGDSFLVAGSRGMGKTGEIHGWIQALLEGGKVEVYAFDGKRGVEFSRYIGHPMFRMVHKLSETLTALKTVAVSRRRKLLASGQPNILLYNELHPDEPMVPIALFVDEAALANDEEKGMLVEIVSRERDTGFYPVLATNNPLASQILMKANLVTRICFPVPSWNVSQMVLGMNGAESLDKVQGRGLIVFKARVTEFQSFRVSYPKPSEETVKLMLEQDQVRAEDEAGRVTQRTLLDQPEPTAAVDTETVRIMELAKQGKGASAIIGEIWQVYGGGSFYKRKAQVEAVLAQNGTSSSTSAPISGSELGLQGI